MHFSTKFTRPDAESSWPEFVRWIGFSTLSDALRRKHASLEEWSAFRDVTPRLFSIEVGLAKILKRWRSTRKISFPNEKSTYDALEFVGCCTTVRHQISIKEAEQFRRRIISEILPSGRLCHLDHEFRIAQNLVNNGWKINHFGFCGDPGPDFIAQRGGEPSKSKENAFPRKSDWVFRMNMQPGFLQELIGNYTGKTRATLQKSKLNYVAISMRPRRSKR